MKLKLTFIAHI